MITDGLFFVFVFVCFFHFPCSFKRVQGIYLGNQHISISYVFVSVLGLDDVKCRFFGGTTIIRISEFYI